MQKKVFKSEKGSITLFVLLAILFFLIVIFSVFMNSSNKNRIQMSELDRIKQEYDKDVNRIDEIYDETASRELIQVAFDSNGGTVNIAKDGTVDISSNISITYKEGMTVVSREYGWSNSPEQEPSSWTSFSSDSLTVENPNLGQGSYYLWVRVENNQNVINTTISNVFQVNENEIGLSKNTEGYTQDKMTVTIDYKDTYVTNKKVGFGKTLEEAMQNAVANDGTTIEVTENGFVYVTAEDAYGNVSSSYIEVDNIDTEGPMITLTPNGGEYVVKEGETTKISVDVKVEDDISGVDEVKYYWSTTNTEKPSEEDYKTIGNNSAIPSEPVGEGTYYLWIKATDNAGNEREEPSYVYVVRPPLAPTVSLKENDANGAEYTSGTWTNQDVYHEISMPKSEGTVEKYQYSNDGTTWEDINGELKQGELNYTTAFPMSTDNKPDWLGDLTNNGDEYFEENANGGIEPTNGGRQNNKHNTTANSYIKIDLSEYTEEDILNITINAQVSSESGFDYGYATITNSINAPAYNSSTGRFIYISGTSSSVTTAKDYSTTLTGGQIYYLHFGYRKDSSGYRGDDTFTINSITLTSETMGKKISFNNYTKNENIITYVLQDEINEDFYLKAIYEDGTESGTSQFRIQIDKTAPVIGNISTELLSQTNIKLTLSNIQERLSGLKGYYISTENTAPTVDSNWVSVSENTFDIENLNTGTNYYIWIIDNANNISEMTTIDAITPNYRIDNSKYAITLEEALNLANNNSTIELLNDYTDSSTATINKNITLNTGDYTLTRTATITINEGTTDNPIIFELNGKITSSSDINILTTNNYATIQGTGTIESTVSNSNYSAIYNTGNLTQEGELTISGYYGINNSSGTVNINSGTIAGNDRGIYTRSSGTTNINGGYISGTYGIYTSSSSANVNVLGGTVVGSTYGIYGYTTGDGKIKIGDIETEVNQVSPVVSGGQYGIYMRNNNSYNFYNGIIMGTNTKPYTNIVNPREGYMVYTFYDYKNARRYCAVLTTAVDEIEITHTPTEWTNQDVTVEIKYPIIESTTLQYSKDGENWETIENGNGNRITVSENTIIYARMLDASGIVLQSAEHEIANIDKISPTITIDPETTKYIVDDNTPTINLQVTASTADEGGSGLDLKQYAWGDSKDTEPTEWNDFGAEDSITITKNDCAEGTYYLWFKVTDLAGNRSDVTAIRYIVEYKDFVAKIGENYYYTIQEAVDSASTTASVVEILKDTDEVTTINEGQNITIELNGHIVGSSTSEQSTFTNNGTLTIIDTNEEKTGTIENLIGTGIENNGTLTIGNNSNSIDDNTPTISGKNTGITNNNTLNYYDGTIIGKSAINGNVQSTPESYGPVGTYREDGMTVVNLKIVSDYVARIEWFYYPTLQSAFDACPARENNTEQTTVHMLKDIVLDDTVSAYYGQNIRLDLNGYMLTNSNNTILNIVQNSKLEITDLTEEQNGNITSSVAGTDSLNCYKMIVNNGYLNIAGGNILSEQKHNYPIYNAKGTVDICGGNVRGIGSNTRVYGIYNASTGTINITGGNILSSGSNYYTYTYGIYNNSSGTVNVINGIIDCVSTDYYTYGICNNSTGTINITGGTINSGGDDAYGIYNASTGTINITGGTINSSGDDAYGIYNTNTGAINITRGSVNSSGVDACGVKNSSTGILNISESTIISDAYYATGITNSYAGTINITKSTVNSSTSNYSAYGIDNSDGTINVIESTIISNSNTNTSYAYTYGIYNTSNGTINIIGSNITNSSNSSSSYAFADAYGIYNNSTGIINITEGTIHSTSTLDTTYGIYNNSSGTIAIGIKGDGFISNNSPIIVATYSGTSSNIASYGIFNNEKGNIFFYDGIIQATYLCIYGGITGIEENSEIKEDEQDEYKRIYLDEQNNSNYILENVSTGKQYSDFIEAIEETKENSNELKVMKNFTLSTHFIIPEEKDIILDLNGKTIFNKYFRIINYGNLEITDNSLDGKIENIDTYISNKNNGKINLTGGTVSSSNSSNNYYGFYAIYNSSIGIINIIGGNVNINGNNLSNVTGYSAYGIYNSNIGTINVIGGTINCDVNGYNVYGIYNSNAAIINVTGGKISSSNDSNAYGIYNKVGTINVTGGKVSSSNYGIYNDGIGTINVTGGEINSNGSNYIVGIHNNSSGTINVTEGLVSSSSSSKYSAFGIRNSSTGTIYVAGGSISVISSNSNAYGIYNPSTGIITIGTKGDGIVSSNEPNIVATHTETATSYGGYGIYNTKGIFNFYDGRIEGSTKALYDDSEITEVEEIQQPQKSDDEKIYAYGLEATDVARIVDKTYLSLQDAINEATENDVIEILRGIQYTNQNVTLTISNDKNITIDLQNHPIVSAIEGPVFTVEGNLKILNTVEGENAKITSSNENTIYVKQGGTLEINNVTITNNESGNNVIENTGTVNITGGTVSQLNTSGYAINNTSTGVVNISYGTVEANECSIYNVGKVNMTGGTVTAYYNAITNTSFGILNIENGIVTTTKYSSTVIKNQENASININAGEITVSSFQTQYGINNTSVGTINIIGGNISALTTNTTSYKAYGIYSTAGTINIGTKDENVNSESPIILGTTNGIYINTNSTLNIYDGIIKGITSAIVGDITSLEEQSEIVVGEETISSKIYETVSLVKVDSPIASVESTEYYSLKEAFDSITGTGTVQVLRTGVVAETINISYDKNIIIDLNGNILNMYTNFNNNGTLKVTDTSSEALGVLTGYKAKVIDNTDTFELLNGTISEMTYGVYNNGGIINISGGTLRDNEYGIYNVAGGTANVASGNITVNTYGIFNYSGNMNVSGGAITENEYGLYNSSGTVNITNGTVTGNTYGVFNYNGATNVSSGNITGNNYGVYNSSGTTNISNLTITGNTTEVCNGGTGTTNILSGNIISDTIAVTNTSSGRINIGTQDSGYNSNSPVIQGEQFGISNTGSGSVAFYDGTIKGKVGSIQGYYLYTETGYKAQTNIVDGYYCDTLALSGDVTTIAKIGDIEYTNLQSAINACTSSTPTTITLVNSVNSNLMFTIEEGQNIIMDLNGCTITTSSLETLMQNAGTLTIIDTSDRQTGRITNSSGVAINSTGTLTLGEDDGTVSTVCPEISGSSTGIVTTGTFNFYDGIIKGATALEGTVTSRPDGYVINSSTDQATGYDQLVLGR